MLNEDGIDEGPFRFEENCNKVVTVVVDVEKERRLVTVVVLSTVINVPKTQYKHSTKHPLHPHQPYNKNPHHKASPHPNIHFPKQYSIAKRYSHHAKTNAKTPNTKEVDSDSFVKD